jgi:hypothetical protein
MGQRAWRIALCLYAAVACVDFAHHLIYDVYSSDRGVRYSQLPVAYSAALFWPVDLVAMALLATQLHTESR